MSDLQVVREALQLAQQGACSEYPCKLGDDCEFVRALAALDSLEAENKRVKQALFEEIHALEIQNERLKEALVDALEGMLDMRGYVGNYFAEKWDHDGYIARAKATIAGGDDD